MNNYYLLAELYRTLQTLLPLARVGLLINLVEFISRSGKNTLSGDRVDTW